MGGQKGRPWSGALTSAKWPCPPSRTNACCTRHQTWVSLGDPLPASSWGRRRARGRETAHWRAGIHQPHPPDPLFMVSVISGHFCFCSVAPPPSTQHRRPSLQAHWISQAAWLWWPVVAEQEHTLLEPHPPDHSSTVLKEQWVFCGHCGWIVVSVLPSPGHQPTAVFLRRWSYVAHGPRLYGYSPPSPLSALPQPGTGAVRAYQVL